MSIHQEISNFIWQIADLLRGPYRPPQYERVMLPMTVLRRFDCVLEPTKAQVLAAYRQAEGSKLTGDALDLRLNRVAGQYFHNHSPQNFATLRGDPNQLHLHLVSYIAGFSANVRRIFDYFEFEKEIEKMREADILYLVTARFSDLDLHTDRVDNIQMGLLFEDPIRRFNEQANETAGDYFTPRDVIKLMVDLLFLPDDDLLGREGRVCTLFDPTCGTGGMLSEALKHVHELDRGMDLYVSGQDFNPRAYAIAASEMLLQGYDDRRIRFGDSLTDDQFKEDTFDYFLANPPFGVDWKRQHKEIVREHEKEGYAGRFGAGLPRVNDGALLFLQHMLKKFVPVAPQMRQIGSRLAIVFNGSPLFTGGAGSGESNIRKWILENDWLEAIIALPEQMFYNTGIGTYIWIVTNRKETARRGKIQLLDARPRWKPMRRSLGDKRRLLGDDDIAAIVREYGDLRDSETCRIFDNADFGYTRVTVERPLRLRFQIDLDHKARFFDVCPHLLDDVQALDAALGRELYRDWNAVLSCVRSRLEARGSRWKAIEQKVFREVFTERDAEAAPVIARQEPLRSGQTISEADRFAGWFPLPPLSADCLPDSSDLPALFPAPKSAARLRFEPDADLRDFENIPLKEEIDAYFRREVLPHVPDAWMEREKDKIGYEINFNRHFYRYTPPRPLEEIDADLKAAEEEIVRLLREVTT